jgi:DNA repair photolyase
VSKEAAETNLETLEQSWGKKYPVVLSSSSDADQLVLPVHWKQKNTRSIISFLKEEHLSTLFTTIP